MPSLSGQCASLRYATRYTFFRDTPFSIQPKRVSESLMLIYWKTYCGIHDYTKQSLLTSSLPEYDRTLINI